MKKYIHLLLVLLTISFSACQESVVETITYSVNEPVFMARETFRGAVKVSQEPREITGYGKIIFYNGYLYMSEPDKGIHIIDNTNPADPQVVGYIELMGNADLSIRQDMLYADSYIDLVWFDVSNPLLPELKGRLENVFPEAIPPLSNTWGIDYEKSYGESRGDSIIVGWREVERVESLDYYYSRNHYWGWLRGDFLNFAESTYTDKGGMSNSVGGSMSRFSIYQDYLYAVIRDQMTIFDLSPAQPVKAAESLYIGWSVETIFSYKQHMYLGTPTGLVIYSVEDPLNPVYTSSIQHVYGCDPVVVENDIAYVTIRSGNNCGQNSNKLIVIDVANPAEPNQLKSYDMIGPKGLGIENNILFVCDDGVQIFRADNPLTILDNKLAHYTGMDGYDLIPFHPTLMMIATEGIYQYNYSDLTDIKQISFLPVGQDD